MLIYSRRHLTRTSSNMLVLVPIPLRCCAVTRPFVHSYSFRAAEATPFIPQKGFERIISSSFIYGDIRPRLNASVFSFDPFHNSPCPLASETHGQITNMLSLSSLLSLYPHDKLQNQCLFSSSSRTRSSAVVASHRQQRVVLQFGVSRAGPPLDGSQSTSGFE